MGEQHTAVGLAGLTQARLEAWATEAVAQSQYGRLPSYIPRLAAVDRSLFAVEIRLVDGSVYTLGQVGQRFALMSVVKPLLLLFLLNHLGRERVLQKVGLDPSDQPFHSLRQLTLDLGFPRNPMINSGAIALAACLPGDDGASRCEALRQWLNHVSGANLMLDDKMLASVESVGNEANRAIAQLLFQSGNLNHVETALDTYNYICCLACTATDLARLGLCLATPTRQIAPADQRTVNALMLTCGLYEASSRFAVRVGLPMKSGVSGALLAVVPRQGAIACYSPALDETGNSIAALYFLEQLAQSLNLSVFG